MKKNNFLILTFIFGYLHVFAQITHRTTDTNTPLYLLPPDYPMPYGPPKPEDIKATIDRVYVYLESCTPTKIINSDDHEIPRSAPRRVAPKQVAR